MLVKRAMESMHWEYICRRLRCTQSTLSCWNTGKTSISYDRGKKLEQMVEVAESKLKKKKAKKKKAKKKGRKKSR